MPQHLINFLNHFLPEESDYSLVEVDCETTFNGKTLKYKAYRLLHNVTGKNFGEAYQAACRSPEWKAALIVFEKYKRKMGLEHKDLLSLRRHLENFSADRKAQGKKCSNDFLVQEASAYTKKICQTENHQ